MINPVLKKELRTRMRTWKTPIIISLYILLISGLFLFVFMNNFMSRGYHHGFRPGSLRDIYLAVAVIQMLLIIYIVPATTAGSISGERERSTFDLLIGTRLSSISIILGKLSSSLVLVILLLIVSIPIMSILLLFGGFSPQNIIVLFAFYIVNAIYFGSIGIFTSAFLKKTSTSTVVSYIIALFLVGGTLFFTIILRAYYFSRIVSGVITVQNPQSFYPIIMYFNPFSGISVILENQIDFNIFDDLISYGTQSNTLSPLYINIGVSLLVSCILLVLSAIRINPMIKIKNIFKRNKLKNTSKKV